MKKTKKIQPTKRRIRNALVAAPLAGACALAALPSAVMGASTPVAGSTTSATELQEAEQRLSAATVSSETVKGQLSFSGRLPQKLAALDAAGITFSGELTATPTPAAQVEVKVGGSSETVLTDGQALYLRDAKLASKDGGKSWVKITRAEVDQLLHSNPTLNSSGLAPDLAHPYAGVAKVLSETKDARSFGTATVDGQSVTIVGGTLPAAKIAEEVFSRKLASGLRDFHIVLPGSFRVDVNAQGVPLLSDTTLLLPGRVKLRSVVEITAVDTAVTVTPPAAGETITATEADAIVKAEKAKK
jgi:hypothetical protein